MPYVDILAHDDYLSFWYTTNTLNCNVSGFDPAKPTILLIPPLAFDSSWLSNQFGDPRLNGSYNMIAFDSRFAGRTRSRPNPSIDLWVEAADLALACQTLQLHSVHIWAEESLAVNVALRFALLFPDMCLSLALITVGPPTELPSYHSSFEETVRMWSFAEDLDGLEHAAHLFLNLTVGYDLDPEETDNIVSYWQTTYPPFQRVRLAGAINLTSNRIPLSSYQLSLITQPVLILHGENNALHPIKHAQQLSEDLQNSNVSLSVLKGCAGYLSLIPTCASILNKIYVKFVSRIPPPESTPLPVPIPISMKRALATLAGLVDRPMITMRDPMSPMSFSVVTPEVEKQQREVFISFIRGQTAAFSPLGEDGRPLRKFSERKDGHWSNGDHQGMSHAGGPDSATLKLPSNKSNPPAREKTETMMRPPEPVTLEMVIDSGLRRTGFSTYSVDKLSLRTTLSRTSVISRLPVKN
ncbi:alpha/beta-hydrolase [Artomyces pyxidatus]|uniref:Alpha/beta-hydrolase n=1 Tax=Artomyces pyxidatus TaxID=48021 RepID=A0ACB8TLF4_9AGAM|nr:alpha/beta-hydrolase [Artomyces pyxidatus]